MTAKIGKLFAYVAIFLVVIAVFGFFVHFTNGFTSDFSTFYVICNGKEVLNSAGGFAMNEERPLEIEVKYTFGLVSDESSGYSVRVVPNIKSPEDFTFYMNGEPYSFQGTKDLTQGFIIEEKENSFTIKPKGSLTKILSSVYNNGEIESCDDKAYTDMFMLVITSYNGERAVNIAFSLSTITGIDIDKNNVIF